jgi:hypothetical protein
MRAQAASVRVFHARTPVTLGDIARFCARIGARSDHPAVAH